MAKMTQKDAILVLMDFYGVQMDDNSGNVGALNTIQADTIPDNVWDAWSVLARKAMSN